MTEFCCRERTCHKRCWTEPRQCSKHDSCKSPQAIPATLFRSLQLGKFANHRSRSVTSDAPPDNWRRAVCRHRWAKRMLQKASWHSPSSQGRSGTDLRSASTALGDDSLETLGRNLASHRRIIVTDYAPRTAYRPLVVTAPGVYPHRPRGSSREGWSGGPALPRGRRQPGSCDPATTLFAAARPHRLVA